MFCHSLSHFHQLILEFHNWQIAIVWDKSEFPGQVLVRHTCMLAASKQTCCGLSGCYDTLPWMWFGFYGSKPYKPIMSWISEYLGWHNIMQYPDIVHDFSFLLLLCNDQDIVYIGYICTCRSTVCCMRGVLLMPYSSKPKASENIALSAKCGDITRVILGRAWVSPTQMCEKWAMSVCLSVCLFTRFMVNTHLWMFLTSWQKWLKS